MLDITKALVIIHLYQVSPRPQKAPGGIVNYYFGRPAAQPKPQCAGYLTGYCFSYSFILVIKAIKKNEVIVAGLSVGAYGIKLTEMEEGVSKVDFILS
jgi:hypothetical protein